MKRIILFALLTAVLPCGSLRAQEFRTDINPALIYYQALMLAPKWAEADQDYLLTNNWNGRAVDERFKKLLALPGHEFTLLRRAAQSKAECDWGIDLSDGPYTLLPHLGPLKRAAQTLCLHAMWQAREGAAFSDEAREDLLAALALGRNTSRDGTLIACLVQIAIENMVCKTIAENFYLLPPETLRRIEPAFDAAPPRGLVASAAGLDPKVRPAGPARSVVADRVSSERGMFVDGWLVREMRGIQEAHRGDDARAFKAILELFDKITSGQEAGSPPPYLTRETFTKAAGGTSAGAIKLVQDLGPFYDRATMILRLPYREFAGPIAQFDADIAASTNPLAREFIPAFMKSRQKEFMAVTRQAMVRAAIEYKLHGEEGLKSVLDPCGSGPFAFEPFSLGGVRRGFKLTSAYEGADFKSMIFVEKDGKPFYIDGKTIGEPVPRSSARN